MHLYKSERPVHGESTVMRPSNTFGAIYGLFGSWGARVSLFCFLESSPASRDAALQDYTRVFSITDSVTFYGDNHRICKIYDWFYDSLPVGEHMRDALRFREPQRTRM